MIAVAMILVAIALGGLARGRARSRMVSCNCHLKQVGLAFRVFANDHGDAFPQAVSNRQGGSLEDLSGVDAFPHFRAMSNELSTPRVLVCPADTRRPASSFQTLSNANISYFLSLDALDTYPQSLLSGDSNLTTNGVAVRSGLLVLTTNSALGFSQRRHRGSGMILLGDGSAQTFNGARLKDQADHPGFVTNRILIP